MTRNIRGRPSEGEGEAGAAHMKTRPASVSPPRRLDIAALDDAGRRPGAGYGGKPDPRITWDLNVMPIRAGCIRCLPVLYLVFT